MPSRPLIQWTQIEASTSNEGRQMEIFMAAMREQIASSKASPTLPYGADHVGITYSGGIPTGAVYKTGGASGTVVKTLTMANDGTNITSVTAS